MTERRSVFGRSRRHLAWLLLSLWLVSSAVFAAPRIGVVTMQPGEVFWERFGHDAIVVVDDRTGEATSYNFGFFDPGEPDFVSNFIKGVMRYRLAALPFEQDMAIYDESGRGVDVQWLALEDNEAQSLADALAVNALPENAYYGYQYFLDNCSTRVRDAVDRALGGRLRQQLQGRSQGNTYRSEALRLASPAPWMWLGFDIGLGPLADQPMSLWQEAFVPMRLADALRDIKLDDGRSLVSDKQPLLEHRIAPAPAGNPIHLWRWATAGLLIAAAGMWLGRRRPRLLAGFALAHWSVSGVVSALMLFIWLGTGHEFGWRNHNLLLFSPLAWCLLPGGWRAMRGREPGRVFRGVLVAVTISAVIALFWFWLAPTTQRNLHWIVSMLPIQLALAATFLRTRNPV